MLLQHQKFIVQYTAKFFLNDKKERIIYMLVKRKVRNLRNERRFIFLFNLLIIFIILSAANLILPESGAIGNRSMTTLYAVNGVLTIVFMWLLEKYAITATDLYEQFVITSLSCIYAFAIVSIINLVFFTSKNKLIADAAITVANILSVFFIDLLLNRVFSNPKFYQKPKLLIIDSAAKNFARMKKIKYGVLKNYDSWYESLEGVSADNFQLFAQEQFPRYDAVCVLDGLSDFEYYSAVNTAMKLNKDLFIVPRIVDVGKTNARFVRLDDVLTLYMPKKSLSQIELAIKRISDIIIAFLGLIIAIIPMAVIAAAIKITSPGPILYKQVRLTQYKKKFEIYKFRTMIPDAEKFSGPKFSEKNDPRITPIGKILRACRMDELPQLINVLRGDMSMVGPRPERPVFVERFETEIENYEFRFSVKAGLTSLSHVYGRYSTYIHDRTYYDLFYITHYSIFMDLKILLLTTKTIFLKSAAEGEDDFKQKTMAKNNSEVNIG